MLTENDKTIIRLGQYIAHLEQQGVQLCQKIQELEKAYNELQRHAAELQRKLDHAVPPELSEEE